MEERDSRKTDPFWEKGMVDFDSDFTVDDDLLKNLDITRLFGKETLEEAQEKIANVTQLGMVTVNYKGAPVTKPILFSDFCKRVREDKDCCQRCYASDAFGAIQAAVTYKRYLYFCPCGLLEMAIPIVFQGQYLGGVLCGQTRCDNAPDDIARLQNVMHPRFDYQENPELRALYEKIPVVDFAYFSRIADMVSLVFQQICEKEIYRRTQNGKLKRELEAQKKKISKLETEATIREAGARRSHRLNPYFFINMLSAAANLAIMEDASRTNEMALLLIAHVQDVLLQSQESWVLMDEMEELDRYLKMETIRYANSVTYTVLLPEKMSMQKIPRHVLLPFVERAVFCGVTARAENVHITISCAYQGNNVEVRVAEDGGGLSDQELSRRFEIFDGGHERDFIHLSIAQARERMVSLFGPEYDVEIRTMPSQGSECLVRYPKRFG